VSVETKRIGTRQQAKWALYDVVTLAGSDVAMAATKLTAGGDLGPRCRQANADGQRLQAAVGRVPDQLLGIDTKRTQHLVVRFEPT
jgi:hypothetical protein